MDQTRPGILKRDDLREVMLDILRKVYSNALTETIINAIAETTLDEVSPALCGTAGGHVSGRRHRTTSRSISPHYHWSSGTASPHYGGGPGSPSPHRSVSPGSASSIHGASPGRFSPHHAHSSPSPICGSHRGDRPTQPRASRGPSTSTSVSSLSRSCRQRRRERNKHCCHGYHVHRQRNETIGYSTDDEKSQYSCNESSCSHAAPQCSHGHTDEHFKVLRPDHENSRNVNVTTPSTLADPAVRTDTIALIEGMIRDLGDVGLPQGGSSCEPTLQKPNQVMFDHKRTKPGKRDARRRTRTPERRAKFPRHRSGSSTSRRRERDDIGVNFQSTEMEICSSVASSENMYSKLKSVHVCCPAKEQVQRPIVPSVSQCRQDLLSNITDRVTLSKSQTNQPSGNYESRSRKSRKSQSVSRCNRCPSCVGQLGEFIERKPNVTIPTCVYCVVEARSQNMACASVSTQTNEDEEDELHFPGGVKISHRQMVQITRDIISTVLGNPRMTVKHEGQCESKSHGSTRPNVCSSQIFHITNNIVTDVLAKSGRESPICFGRHLEQRSQQVSQPGKSGGIQHNRQYNETTYEQSNCINANETTRTNTSHRIGYNDYTGEATNRRNHFYEYKYELPKSPPNGKHYSENRRSLTNELPTKPGTPAQLFHTGFKSDHSSKPRKTYTLFAPPSTGKTKSETKRRKNPHYKTSYHNVQSTEVARSQCGDSMEMSSLKYASNVVLDTPVKDNEVAMPSTCQHVSEMTTNSRQGNDFCELTMKERRCLCADNDPSVSGKNVETGVNFVWTQRVEGDDASAIVHPISTPPPATLTFHKSIGDGKCITSTALMSPTKTGQQIGRVCGDDQVYICTMKPARAVDGAYTSCGSQLENKVMYVSDPTFIRGGNHTVCRATAGHVKIQSGQEGFPYHQPSIPSGKSAAVYRGQNSTEHQNSQGLTMTDLATPLCDVAYSENRDNKRQTQANWATTPDGIGFHLSTELNPSPTPPRQSIAVPANLPTYPSTPEMFGESVTGNMTPNRQMTPRSSTTPSMFAQSEIGNMSPIIRQTPRNSTTLGMFAEPGSGIATPDIRQTPRNSTTAGIFGEPGNVNITPNIQQTPRNSTTLGMFAEPGSGNMTPNIQQTPRNSTTAGIFAEPGTSDMFNPNRRYTTSTPRSSITPRRESKPGPDSRRVSISEGGYSDIYAGKYVSDQINNVVHNEMSLVKPIDETETRNNIGLPGVDIVDDGNNFAMELNVSVLKAGEETVNKTLKLETDFEKVEQNVTV